MGYRNPLNKNYSYEQRTLICVMIFFVSSCSPTINNSSNNITITNSNSKGNSSISNSLNQTTASLKIVTVSNVTLFVDSPAEEFVCRTICTCRSFRYSKDDPDTHSVSCQIPDTLAEIPLMQYWNQTENVHELYVFQCITLHSF